MNKVFVFANKMEPSNRGYIKLNFGKIFSLIRKYFQFKLYICLKMRRITEIKVFKRFLVHLKLLLIKKNIPSPSHCNLNIKYFGNFCKGFSIEEKNKKLN